jgi:squalene-associated FAD-dependent desaturase
VARPVTTVAVIGAGWAGIAAAVHTAQRGHAVVLFEMARQLGGRARTVEQGGARLDNGQHILIGAYTQTLALMAAVGVDPSQVLLRRPLALTTPDGRGLRLPPGAPIPAFVCGVLAQRGWPLSDRLSLLRHATAWSLRGFVCDPMATVAVLCRGLPASVRRELIEPLCVAALNTPARDASAQIFLRVLRDALFSGAGSADLLLPTRPLGELLPDAAGAWLQARGAQVRLASRVQTLHAEARQWRVDDEPFGRVVLACSAVEAARLAGPHAPGWSARAQALRYEPIISVVVDWQGTRLPAPMLALSGEPAQFVFDQGALGGVSGRLVFAISGAQRWVDAGLDATAQATLGQARDQLAAFAGSVPPVVVSTMAERRATFRCSPGLERPGMLVADRLLAAGDYVDGPYPATLEGAVLSGRSAALAIDA